MQKYKFIVRYDHEEDDVALALAHIGVLKAEMNYIGTDKKGNPIIKKSDQKVFRKDTSISEPQRDGDILILVATQKEKDGNQRFADYGEA